MKILRPQEPVAKRYSLVAVFLGLLFLFGVWFGVSQHYAAAGKSVLLPSPKAVGERFMDMLGWGPATQKRVEQARKRIGTEDSDALAAEIASIRERSRDSLETLGSDLLISFKRVTGAFLLAALLAIPLGVFIGSFQLLEAFFQPGIEFMRYLPVPALIPVLIILFGVDEAPKIMLIFLGTFFQLTLMVSDEVRRVPAEMVRACYALGGTVYEVVTTVIMRSAMPGIFDALRMCNGWAWTWLIVAELVAANEGMGFRIIRLQRYLQTDTIFIYLIVLGLVGLFIDFLFRLMNRHLFQWNHVARS